MLDEYFQGTLPQLIERGRLLKAKIPRGLPRDYDGLIRSCEFELDEIIGRLRGLQNIPAGERPSLTHAYLRQFKRTVADLDHLETTAIAALNRAQDDDHHANRLLYRICQEIKHPVATPTVTMLSTGYFYIDTKLNLMFIPPAEGSFLLHLPDLYHELGHPLLTHRDHPVLDRLRSRYLQATEFVHDYFAEERAKEDRRRGPRAFKDQIDVWELLWSKYWITEFFCDLYATCTLGPAFAWSHLHLYMKMGGDAHAVPDAMRPSRHPADDARMRAALAVLERLKFGSDVQIIGDRWCEALRLSADSAGPNYIHCYPDVLIDAVVESAIQGVTDIECRMTHPDTSDPIHLLLNHAWTTFWRNPGKYHQWESAAVEELFSYCEDKTANISATSASNAATA